MRDEGGFSIYVQGYRRHNHPALSGLLSGNLKAKEVKSIFKYTMFLFFGSIYQKQAKWKQGKISHQTKYRNTQ